MWALPSGMGSGPEAGQCVCTCVHTPAPCGTELAGPLQELVWKDPGPGAANGCPRVGAAKRDPSESQLGTGRQAAKLRGCEVPLLDVFLVTAPVGGAGPRFGAWPPPTPHSSGAEPGSVQAWPVLLGAGQGDGGLGEDWVCTLTG